MTTTIVHPLPVDGQAWLKCHIERTSKPVDVDAFDAALEVPAEAANNSSVIAGLGWNLIWIN